MIVILNTEKYVEKLQWKTLEGGREGGGMKCSDNSDMVLIIFVLFMSY